MTSDYAGYSEWKRWDPSEFMVCGPYERRYYKGELGGLELAGQKIVELGFGNGGFLRYAMDEGANVGGTELLTEAARARRSAARGSICRTSRMRRRKTREISTSSSRSTSWST